MQLTLTLREAFDAYYLPDLKATGQPATVERFGQTLRRWERLTGNPPVGSIDNASLAAFRKAMLDQGYRPATFNANWRDLRAVLRRLAPQETKNPLGLGLLARVPYVKTLRENLPRPRRVTFEELDAMYAACESARWPHCCVPAPEWWRAALVLAYNLGPRLGDLFGLRTRDLVLDGDDPRAEFIAAKTGKQHSLPLNETVVAHLRGIWSDRELVFPGAAAGIASKSLHRERHRLQDLAGVHFTMHDCRRTCGSAFASVGGLDLARYVLGHASVDVTVRFYVDFSDLVRKAARELPQPPSFRVAKCHVVPPAIRRGDWRFEPGAAIFLGRPLHLAGRELAILKALVSAGRPLGFEELAGVAWWDLPAVDRQTVKGAVHRLRGSLSRAFALSPAHDPLPWDRFGDRGWTLVLPENAIIRRQMRRPGTPERNP